MAQLPQWVGSWAMSTQLPPQAVRPAPQETWHCPPAQTLPAPQACPPGPPQTPQLLGSFCRSLQAIEPLVWVQAVSPAAQTTLQTPATQPWPEGQALEQVPQLLGSFWASLQTPLHEVSPV